MRRKSRCLSNSAELDEAEEKPIMGFIPVRRWSAQSSEPHETMRMGFYYLKFLTAVFGL